MDALSLLPGSAPALMSLLRRSLSWVVALAATLILSACGGGGGGTDPAPPSGPGTTAPTITTQPASQSVTAPTAATFSVVATGSPAYQWQMSVNAGLSFSNIAGATGASYTTPATAVSDTGKQFRVVVGNPAGTVISSAAMLTVGGGGTTLAGYPYSITIDASNTLWVTVLPSIYSSPPSFGGLIQSVSLSGSVNTLAGSATPGSANGTGTAAQFNGPMGLTRDSAGDIYVADALNNVLRNTSSAGVVSTLAGGPSSGFVNGSGTAARFSDPRGVAVDNSGNIYVADRGNDAIRMVSPAGVVSTLAGSGLPGSTDGTGTAASFFNPEGIAVDAAGIVYVADTSNSILRRVTPTGVVTTLAGGRAAGLTDPRGLAIDSSGNLIVADTGHNRIVRVTPSGVVTTLAGSGTSGFVNGTGTAASFFRPMGVAVDASGNVYVADTGNRAIRLVTPGGVVTTLVN